MFDKSKVEEVVDLTKREQWPYPIIFNMLIEAGVTHYETDVARYEIIYAGEGGQFIERGPKNFQIQPAPTFNPDSLKRALQRTQRGQTTYPQFLREIAAAGVQAYRVDMASRTVTYLGVQGEKQVESVPQP